MDQIPLSENARAFSDQIDKERGDGTHELTHDLAYKRLVMVNVMYYGRPQCGDREWVLIDAALPGTAGAIASAAEERFGEISRPAAIILTHGHFDHVGALEALAARWDVPIYAHRMELPYLDGRSAYAPPDPSVGGGMMAATSGMLPKGPFDFSKWLQTLPDNGSVPHMPGWRWIATPGHTPGHISLWREADRCLIVGDAFVTTKQESIYATMTQEIEMHGPPQYFTQDWESARRSVQELAALEPNVVVTGHGQAMQGAEMRAALNALAADFDHIAVPKQGRYVGNPAVADETGTVYVPPKD
ncbi:MAG TPA: MBL fold metallo-hydrolase [Fimbriimonadaceae bacterium]|nr:MBL fold metallo-hydrolase [Fimbriimonadaceae bacterium]